MVDFPFSAGNSVATPGYHIPILFRHTDAAAQSLRILEKCLPTGVPKRKGDSTKIGLSENGGCPKTIIFIGKVVIIHWTWRYSIFQPKLNIEIVLHSVFDTNLTSNQMFSADKWPWFIIILEVLVEVTHSRMVGTNHYHSLKFSMHHITSKRPPRPSFASCSILTANMFLWSHGFYMILLPKCFNHRIAWIEIAFTTSIWGTAGSWQAIQPVKKRPATLELRTCPDLLLRLNIHRHEYHNDYDPSVFFLRFQTAGRLCYPRARSQSIARASYAPCVAAIGYKKQSILLAAQPKAKFCSWAAREEEQRTPTDSISIRRLEALSIPPQKHFDLLVLGQQGVLWHRSFLGKSPQILHYHLCKVGQCVCCLFTTNFSGQHVAA